MTLADAIALYEQHIGAYGGEWHDDPDPEEFEGLVDGIPETWPRIRPVIEAAANEGDEEAAIALRQGDDTHALANHMVNHEEERTEGCPICEAEYRDKYWGAFGPVSEADITRAPPPGDAPVEHAHSDDEQLYALHSHPGGAEPHDHDWDED